MSQYSFGGWLRSSRRSTPLPCLAWSPTLKGLAVRDAKITVTNLRHGRRTYRSRRRERPLHHRRPGPRRHTNSASRAAPTLPLSKIPPSSPRRHGNHRQCRLGLGTQKQSVTVTTESAPVETTRSESAQTVEQRQIDNLPINGRNYVNFTLINSQVTRDNAPSIGPAPTSGLSISGARGRGNMVSVDSANAVDPPSRAFVPPFPKKPFRNSR